MLKTQAGYLCRLLLSVEAERPTATKCLAHPYFSLALPDEELQPRRRRLSYYQRKPLRRGLCRPLAPQQPRFTRYPQPPQRHKHEGETPWIMSSVSLGANAS